MHQMDSIIDKDNSPDFKKPVNFVSPIAKFRSIEEKMARLLSKIVASRAGRISDMSIRDLSEHLKIGINELIAFCNKTSNLSKVRGLVSKRMYGIKLSFEGDYLSFGAVR